MISWIELENFRSVRAPTRLSLERDLTVLVGRNAAGKSSLVDGVQVVSECARERLSSAVHARGGMEYVGHRGAPASPTRLQVAVEDEKLTGEWAFSFQRGNDGVEVVHEAASQRLHMPLTEQDVRELQDQIGPMAAALADRIFGRELRFERRGQLWVTPAGLTMNSERGLPLPWMVSSSELALANLQVGFEYEMLRRHLERYEIVNPSVSWLRFPQQMGEHDTAMQEDGHGWATALRRLLHDDTARTELLLALHRLTGDIDDVRVTAAHEILLVEFHHAYVGEWLSARHESDGTLRIAALLTALMEPPGTLLVIEDPESMVHPGALPMLMEFAQEAAQKTQVLLTTHSPALLDLVDARGIRVAERDASGTRVSALDPDQLHVLQDQLMNASELLRHEPLRGAPEAAVG